MTYEKEVQTLVSRLKRESESGEMAKKEAARAKEIIESTPKRARELGLDMKGLQERKRGLESHGSGDLDKKEAARAKEVADSQREVTRGRALDMKGLLERKRELESQKK